MWKKAKWLKVPKEEIIERKIYQGDMTGRFAYFRYETYIPAKSSLTVEITANSRYRLWVNEKAVLSGPCKGDNFRQYYETVELTEYLVEGKNVICVQVLYCDSDAVDLQTDERASIYGVIGPKTGHRLAIEGSIYDEKGNEADTVTTGIADWYVYLDNSYYLKSNEITCYLGAVTEEVDFNKTITKWKNIEFEKENWRKAEPACDVEPSVADLYCVGVQPQFRIRKREIPLMYETEDEFCKDFCKENGQESGLLKEGILCIEAQKSKEIILDSGVIKNGYPRLVFEGGKGTRITITYFEKFGGPGADLKRTDYRNGEVIGLADTVTLSGGNNVFEPFWVRTFRFICMHVETADERVFIHKPVFKRTGYPICIESAVNSSTPWVEKLWEISTRTLENCMLETYMDCPYFEQLQFAMDTRLEALFTYTVSNDYRLVKKALLDFHYGMQPEGLTAGKYPSVYLQILSTFSLHYIFMLWEYYQQTKDMDTIQQCRGDIDRILDYYDRKIGNDGLVGRLEFWEFVDWQPAWNKWNGIPAALQSGASTIINLMYAYGLFCGGQLNHAMGRNGLSKEYETRRENILHTVWNDCWDEKQEMFREGPKCKQFTFHAQAWAVLNDMLNKAEARKVLTNVMNDAHSLKCSFSTSYEWFRALEKAEMYAEMRNSLNEWIELLEMECTTCPETPRQARSDCHAWSALPMYEMIRTMAGVHPEGIGWESVNIRPQLLDLENIQGKACTPYGSIEFHYEKRGGKWHYLLKMPPKLNGTFSASKNRIEQLQGGKTYQFEYETETK